MKIVKMHNQKGTSKPVLYFGVAYIVATFLFAFIPDTFFNYGYNYYQFLPIFWLAVPLVLSLMLFALSRHCPKDTHKKTFLLLATLGIFASPFLCWFLRTQIHCFGGDGAVATVASPVFKLSDWIPPLPGKGRLDGYGAGFIAKCCRASGLFEHSSVLTSILSAQIYAVILGALFSLLALVGFHKRLDVLAVIMSLPFVFNFFGNTDNYSFSLFMGLIILLAFVSANARQSPTWLSLSSLAILWGVGMWTHPFHVFWGFPLAYFFAQWLRRFKAFKTLPMWSMSVAFGIVLISAIKLSPNGNHWFLWETAKVPPTFSIDTLTHYLNMILLPALPLLGCLLIERRSESEVRDAIIIFFAASCCFFALAFTIGAVDQFAYQHLLFFICAPLIIAQHKVRISPFATCVVVTCNLSLMIPLVAVHSSDRTVARAEYLYPLDPCQHNRVMSWQTHLGLCLGDNLESNPVIKNAVLSTFANGSRQAMPEGFRGGNYVYHTAFLYHFGEFEQGRSQLYGLLKQSPQVIRWFMSDRPGFIYCNRKKLWEDVDAFLVQQHSPFLQEYRKSIAVLSAKCQQNPYYLKKPDYAHTEY